MMMNKNQNNPLLAEWTTPFSTPPFDQIRSEHFVEAITEAIREASDEIALIAENQAEPDFGNTIEALEYCGEKVGRISSVLYNLNSAETSSDLQEAAREVSPLLTRFSNDITMNASLFGKVRLVYDSMKNVNLQPEKRMLLDRKYRSFILGGAGLGEEKKQRFREISEQLSTLGLRFEENVLAETNAFELHIEDPAQLEGLPGTIIEAAATEAATRNKKGWVFTLHYPSYVPFMQYSSVRELRETMFRAYTSRASGNNLYDNSSILRDIVNLRLEMAQLLGYDCFADMVLGERMAESKEKVESFLDQLYKASHPAAVRDFRNVLSYAVKSGHKDAIERWDWAYYSEKLKKERFDIDDEILRPYFPLEKVKDAVFDLAGKLYGIKFRQVSNIPVYHQEVRTWEVFDSDETFLAIFYADFHPRPGKSGGAWMTCYREQSRINEKNIRPLVSIVTNFSRPAGSRPSTLTFTELTTFLHEFGHSLHAILSDCTYESLSGTNVARDFVELPSQFMENFAFEKEWLNMWAAHYETGEKIPESLIDKIKEASTYNEGYACERQLGFGFLDMAWHTLSKPYLEPILDLEREAVKKTDLFPEVEGSVISNSFTHLFGGGYAAGYYGYKWAEVLDADAFWYFREKGIFNPEIAGAFRKNILERGASDKPDILYRNFRGREPSIEPFLERSGLKND